MKHSVIVISLLNDFDRRNAIGLHLQKFGVAFEFLDAVDGRVLSSWPKEYDRKARWWSHGYDLTFGELGCFLSHRKAWSRCLEKNHPCYIFEDDVILGGCLEEIESALEDTSMGWEVLKLGASRTKKSWRFHVATLGAYNFVEDLNDTSGAFAYAITPAAAKKLLARSVRFSVSVDNYMGQAYRSRVISFSRIPYTVRHADTPSRIPNRGQTRKTVLFRLRRELIRAFDRLRWVLWVLYRAVVRRAIPKRI